MNFKIIVQIIIFLLFASSNFASDTKDNQGNYFKIGLVEYSPGDWNSDETALSELLKFIKNKRTHSYNTFIKRVYKNN